MRMRRSVFLYPWCRVFVPEKRLLNLCDTDGLIVGRGCGDDLFGVADGFALFVNDDAENKGVDAEGEDAKFTTQRETY